MKKLKSIENKILPAGLIGVMVLIWHFVVDKGIIKEYTLPAPLSVIKSLVNIMPEIKEHLFVTLNETVTGFVIAVILSVIISFLMDNIIIIKNALYPLMLISQTVPIILLAPLFALWFGFGQLPRILIVILVCFFPVTISLMEGLGSVDQDMINLFKSMGAGRFKTFRLLKFPAALVNFFSGLRISAAYSIMSAVIGEWMGGKTGLGLYMIRVKHSYAIDKVFAVILLIVILSFLMFKLITLIQHICMPWQKLLAENK